MRPDIYLAEAPLRSVRGHLLAAAVAIGQISSGAYVTGNLFVNSKGSSVTAMNEMLDQMVVCADALQLLTYRLAEYWAWVCDEFDEADARLAQWIAGFDVTPPEALPQGLPGSMATAGVPHINSPTQRRPPPDAVGDTTEG